MSSCGGRVSGSLGTQSQVSHLSFVGSCLPPGVSCSEWCVSTGPLSVALPVTPCPPLFCRGPPTPPPSPATCRRTWALQGVWPWRLHRAWGSRPGRCAQDGASPRASLLARLWIAALVPPLRGLDYRQTRPPRYSGAIPAVPPAPHLSPATAMSPCCPLGVCCAAMGPGAFAWRSAPMSLPGVQSDCHDSAWASVTITQTVAWTPRPRGTGELWGESAVRPSLVSHLSGRGPGRLAL